MNRTKIEWCDYTINPVKGLCPVACPYCYARAMYKRFKWQEEVRWWPEAWDLVDTLKKPSRVFVGSTFELFHESLPYNWMEYNLLTAKKYPQHTFIFLTKQPQNLIKFSPFPENCWVGVTATDQDMLLIALNHFYEHRIAKVQFISLEPFLSWETGHWIHPLPQHLSKKDVDWLIIGAQTNPYKPPEISWVREIVEAADKAGIPVFLKDNLKPLLWHETERVLVPDWARMTGEYDGLGGFLLRQEMPL